MGRVHGDSLLDINTTNMFRSALLICSVAYATAKADASYGYGGYGGYGHLGYAGYGGPVAHAHSTGPHLPNVVQHVPYGYAASGVYRAANAGALHLAKRSADADADADAFYGYGGYGHLGYAGYGARSHMPTPLDPTSLTLSSMCPMVTLLPAYTVLLTLGLFTLLRGPLTLTLSTDTEDTDTPDL